jgi:hypothetical protein
MDISQLAQQYLPLCVLLRASADEMLVGVSRCNQQLSTT